MTSGSWIWTLSRIISGWTLTQRWQTLSDHPETTSSGSPPVSLKAAFIPDDRSNNGSLFDELPCKFVGLAGFPGTFYPTFMLTQSTSISHVTALTSDPTRGPSQVIPRSDAPYYHCSQDSAPSASLRLRSPSDGENRLLSRDTLMDRGGVGSGRFASVCHRNGGTVTSQTVQPTRLVPWCVCLTVGTGRRGDQGLGTRM